MTAADPGKAWRAERGIPIVPTFDGYRALAVVGVLSFHVLQVCGVLLAAGSSAAGILLWGVLPGSLTVFFIVSGFVMFLPTAARGGDFGSVRAFAIGRAARLVPAYWLSLGVAIVLLAVVTGLGGSADTIPGIGPIVAHLAFLQTPALLVDSSFPLGLHVIPPVWTLSVEAGFYIVLPLIAVSYFRRPFLGLAVAAAIVIGWRLAALNVDGIAAAFGANLGTAATDRFQLYYASQLPSWALSLAAGMTAAWCYVRLRGRVAPDVLSRRALWALAAALPALVAVTYIAGHDAVNDPNAFNGLFARQPVGVALTYPLALAAAMVALALAPGWAQRPFANRVMRWVADISYGMYLIHFAIIWFALAELSLPTDGSLGATAAWGGLVFAASITYAYLSSRLLERPVRQWAQGFRRRAQRGYQAHAPA